MKHLIIAGHGKQRNGTFDPGATGLIKKGEHKYVVEDLFPAMKRHLPKGHNLVFFDKYKVSNYGNIASLAKEYGASQITEIHYDAAAESASRGHVIVHKNFAPDKTDLALRDAIKNMLGVRYNHKGHEGISGRDNLYNVNVTAKEGITYRLTELGFGTNKHDADVLVNKVDDYAKELVKALTGKVSTHKPSVKPSPSKPTAKPKPTPGTKGYQGTSVVDYLKYNKINSNFDSRAALAKKHGINGYAGTQSQNDRLLKALRGGKVSTPKPKPTPKPNLKVGSTVTLSKSATRFATGQSILNSAKGKRYKIIQVKSDRVLLSGIMSWVYIKDVK